MSARQNPMKPQIKWDNDSIEDLLDVIRQNRKYKRAIFKSIPASNDDYRYCSHALRDLCIEYLSNNSAWATYASKEGLIKRSRTGRLTPTRFWLKDSYNPVRDQLKFMAKVYKYQGKPIDPKWTSMDEFPRWLHNKLLCIMPWFQSYWDLVRVPHPSLMPPSPTSTSPTRPSSSEPDDQPIQGPRWTTYAADLTPTPPSPAPSHLQDSIVYISPTSSPVHGHYSLQDFDELDQDEDEKHEEMEEMGVDLDKRSGNELGYGVEESESDAAAEMEVTLSTRSSSHNNDFASPAPTRAANSQPIRLSSLGKRPSAANEVLPKRRRINISTNVARDISNVQLSQSSSSSSVASYTPVFPPRDDGDTIIHSTRPLEMPTPPPSSPPTTTSEVSSPDHPDMSGVVVELPAHTPQVTEATSLVNSRLREDTVDSLTSRSSPPRISTSPDQSLIVDQRPVLPSIGNGAITSITRARAQPFNLAHLDPKVLIMVGDDRDSKPLQLAIASERIRLYASAFAHITKRRPKAILSGKSVHLPWASISGLSKHTADCIVSVIKACGGLVTIEREMPLLTDNNLINVRQLIKEDLDLPLPSMSILPANNGHINMLQLLRFIDHAYLDDIPSEIIVKVEPSLPPPVTAHSTSSAPSSSYSSTSEKAAEASVSSHPASKVRKCKRRFAEGADAAGPPSVEQAPLPSARLHLTQSDDIEVKRELIDSHATAHAQVDNDQTKPPKKKGKSQIVPAPVLPSMLDVHTSNASTDLLVLAGQPGNGGGARGELRKATSKAKEAELRRKEKVRTKEGEKGAAEACRHDPVGIDVGSSRADHSSSNSDTESSRPAPHNATPNTSVDIMHRDVFRGHLRLARLQTFDPDLLTIDDLQSLERGDSIDPAGFDEFRFKKYVEAYRLIYLVGGPVETSVLENWHVLAGGDSGATILDQRHAASPGTGLYYTHLTSLVKAAGGTILKNFVHSPSPCPPHRMVVCPTHFDKNAKKFGKIQKQFQPTCLTPLEFMIKFDDAHRNNKKLEWMA